MDIKYPVLCPLMQKEIFAGECFRIHLVVGGEAPTWVAPQKVIDTPNFKQICYGCQYHRDD